MARIAHVTILTLATAGWFGIAACSSSNDPASSNGESGAASVAGASAGMASTAAGAGTTPSAGSSSTVAGASGSGTAAAGSGSSGGPAATGGSGAGTAGTTGAAGSGTSGGLTPLCTEVPVTAAGVAPTKGGACTASDSQLCYKTCGPQSSGFKSETCTAGAYAEQSGCTFPAANDYSCYKLPATPSAACPATPPQASMPCSVAACTPCNAGGMYLDSTGTSKPGYCVCPASTSGASKWSCASSTAWPCPAGKGC